MYKRELVHCHWKYKSVLSLLGFPCGLRDKDPSANAEDAGKISES